MSKITRLRRCPRCEGTGTTVVGWDQDAYENIEGKCFDCNGVGWVEKQYLEWAAAGGPNECEHGYAAGVPCPACEGAGL